MKQKYQILLVMIFATMVNTSVFAYDCEVDGFFFNRISASEFEVTHGIKYSGDIIIPSKVVYNNREFTITSIGKEAFYHCSDLTSVTIPNSVTSIGVSAFRECGGLTSITIPNSVTEIGYDAFFRCTALTSVTIGNSVTFIGDLAFYGCTGLTSVHISDLEAWCKIHFGDSGSSDSNPLRFAHHLYYNETEIKDLIIPNSVTSIGDYAFYGCSGLTSLTIPNSVTSIGWYAFYNCTGLSSVTIGNGMTDIGFGAFKDCSSLTSVFFSSDYTVIGWRAFEGCRSLASISLPSGLKGISPFLFSGCISLKSIKIPDEVTGIGEGAFSECISLKDITIPNKVESLYGNEMQTGKVSIGVFQCCTSLESVVIGEKMKYIFRNTFKGCTSLKALYSLNPTPPLLNVYDWGYVDSPYYQSFDDNHYVWLDIYIPKGSLQAYQSDIYWKKFVSITELYNPTNNNSIRNGEVIELKNSLYSLDGKRICKPEKGVNIIKMGDGSTKKVLVK